MAFSVNTNLGALQAYNALAKINAETQKAQLRLATTKKINSVADDTSGFNVGKQMEAQVLKQKAQLNNVSSAKNYLATAESALQQINDKLNQIAAKYTDAQDPLKDQSSIAKDITTLATEIKSILQTTNINGSMLLVDQSDPTAAAGNKTFDVGGATFSVDFGSKMGTVALLGKIDSLTLDAVDVASAEATYDAGKIAAGVVAGNAAAVTYKDSTLALAVTKLTEGGHVDKISDYSREFNNAFDAAMADGSSATAALHSAFVAGAVVIDPTASFALTTTDVKSGSAALNLTSGGALGVGLDAIGVSDGGANDAAATAYISTIVANASAKMLESGAVVGDVAAWSLAYTNSMATAIAGAADGAVFSTFMAAASTAANTAYDAEGTNQAGDAAVALGDTRVYDTAALSIATRETGITTAYDAAVTAGQYAYGKAVINHGKDVGPTGSFDPTTVVAVSTAATVITAANTLTAASTAIRDSLGRIGNLSQSIDSRSEFLTTSIANSTASISSIFDADMAAEQLNATKGQIAGQITTAMLSQLNSSPQNLLRLFQ